jgi:hypothetical protein
MTLAWAIRCLRALLPVLFLTAQIAGVLPLLHDHTLNVYETTPVASHQHGNVTATAAQLDADHHHGVLDLHDQCCALHALSGPLPHMPSAPPMILLSIKIAPPALRALIGLQPTALDRPPRSSSLS